MQTFVAFLFLECLPETLGLANQPQPSTVKPWLMVNSKISPLSKLKTLQSDFLRHFVKQNVLFSQFKGKYVVLFFYPLDFTFVCPTEIIAFSEAADQFKEINCAVIAASTGLPLQILLRIFYIIEIRF